MAPQFFGQEIAVTVSGEVKVPASFRLGGQEYVVLEIIEAWQDHGFGRSPLRRKRWWLRHHRNYYRVRTTENDVFEIYYDRGTNLKHPEYKKWFLSRQL
ncbi:MAG: hypothetical protein JSW16_01950 [Dehalococcoidales bacterium]|nr:MAG: hypothetical protein JSW16_01950 [Dehalococcoidales bacterium]